MRGASCCEDDDVAISAGCFIAIVGHGGAVVKSTYSSHVAVACGHDCPPQQVMETAAIDVIQHLHLPSSHFGDVDL